MLGWSISASACRSASNRARTWPRVHAGLDELEGDLPLDRLGLLGQVDGAHAALADRLEQRVLAGDHLVGPAVPAGSARGRSRRRPRSRPPRAWRPAGRRARRRPPSRPRPPRSGPRRGDDRARLQEAAGVAVGPEQRIDLAADVGVAGARLGEIRLAPAGDSISAASIEDGLDVRGGGGHRRDLGVEDESHASNARSGRRSCHAAGIFSGPVSRPAPTPGRATPWRRPSAGWRSAPRPPAPRRPARSSGRRSTGG